MADDKELIEEDDLVFYSLLYTSITVLFAMAVLSKFLTNEFRFGFRSFLSLIVLFIGEPLCHFALKGSTGVMTFGLGCLFIYSILPSSHLPVGNKAVLITGCDSGFGMALVKKLDSIGMTVFAGFLYKNGPGAIEIQNSCSDRVKPIQLDVTDEKQIQEAEEYIDQQLDGQGLWGLVNNAGIWYASEIEMTPEKIFRHVLEVNLMGTIHITKAFLPSIRKAKGRILVMSSVTGKVPLEGFAAYSISKHGLEAYADILRMEMKKWGVYVSVIQPAGYSTAGLRLPTLTERRDEVWNNLDEETKATYGWDYFNKIYQNIEASVPHYPTDLTPVTRVMRSALMSKRPRERYTVGIGSGTLMTIFPILPIWIADKLAQLLGMALHDINPIVLQK